MILVIITNAQTVLAKVCKGLANGHTDLSLDGVLVKADITANEYMKA